MKAMFVAWYQLRSLP